MRLFTLIALVYYMVYPYPYPYPIKESEDSYGCYLPYDALKCCWVKKNSCCEYTPIPGRICSKEETICCKFNLHSRIGEKRIYGYALVIDEDIAGNKN